MNIKSVFDTFHWVPKYTLFVLWAIFKESFQKALLNVMGGHTKRSQRAQGLMAVWSLGFRTLLEASLCQ